MNRKTSAKSNQGKILKTHWLVFLRLSKWNIGWEEKAKAPSQVVEDEYNQNMVYRHMRFSKNQWKYCSLQRLSRVLRVGSATKNTCCFKENQSSVPSIHTMAQAFCNSSSRITDALFWPPPASGKTLIPIKSILKENCQSWSRSDMIKSQPWGTKGCLTCKWSMVSWMGTWDTVYKLKHLNKE